MCQFAEDMSKQTHCTYYRPNPFINESVLELDVELVSLKTKKINFARKLALRHCTKCGPSLLHKTFSAISHDVN